MKDRTVPARILDSQAAETLVLPLTQQQTSSLILLPVSRLKVCMWEG